MIPSYFKIEILAIQDEFVLLGRKGLTQATHVTGCPLRGILPGRRIANRCLFYDCREELKRRIAIVILQTPSEWNNAAIHDLRVNFKSGFLW